MLGLFDNYQSFPYGSVESMPEWVRSEKYYNCDDFVDMITHRNQKEKKNKQK